MSLLGAVRHLRKLFGKKKTMSQRSKPSLAQRRAMGVRPKYKPSRRTVRGKTGKVRNDGDGNQKLGAQHGRQLSKLSKNQEFRIRNSLDPIDTLSIENIGIINVPVGAPAKCDYTVFTAGSVDDIENVIQQVEGDNVEGKLYLKDYSMTVKLVNQANTVANLRVYECISRREMIPLPARGSAPACNNIYDYLQYGFLYQNVSQLTSATISSTLYNNPLWCAYNKIVGKPRDVQIAPGKEFVLTLSHNSGKTINPILWENGSEFTEGRYSRHFVVQTIGQPINGAYAGGHDAEPYVSAFKLNWVQMNRYHFQQNWDITGKNYLITNIPTTNPFPGGGVGQLMNQTSGLVDHEQHA